MRVAARTSVVLAVAVVLHTAVAPQLRVAGVAAEVLLAVAVAAGMVAGPERGVRVGFVAGLLADCFLQTPFGLSALTGALVGHGVGLAQGRVVHAAGWIPLATATVAGGAGAMLFAVLGAVLGQSQLLGDDLVAVVAVVALTTGALAPPARRPLRWALLADALPGVRRW